MLARSSTRSGGMMAGSTATGGRKISAFEFWLRTGRHLPVEHKFNGWHDPDDGKFTFKGTGRYFGPGSSGGDRVAMASSPKSNPRRAIGGTALGRAAASPKVEEAASALAVRQDPVGKPLPSAARANFGLVKRAEPSVYNRGAYRTMEDAWAKAQSENKQVSVRIRLTYSGQSRRPDGLEVEWDVAGGRQRREFANKPGGRHD